MLYWQRNISIESIQMRWQHFFCQLWVNFDCSSEILEYLKHHSLIQSALFISKLFFYDNVPTNMSFNERLKAAASALKILYHFCNTFLFTGSFETYFLRLMSIDGNELQGNESDKLVHWCHGAPGVLHMLLLAYKVRKNRGSGTPFILCGSGSGSSVSSLKLFKVRVLFCFEKI